MELALSMLDDINDIIGNKLRKEKTNISKHVAWSSLFLHYRLPFVESPPSKQVLHKINYPDPCTISAVST